MQINPPSPQSQPGSSSIDTKGKPLVEGAGLDSPRFSTLFSTAGNQPSRLTEISANVYRITTDKNDRELTEGDHSTEKKATSETDALVALETPLLNSFQIPKVNITLDSLFKKLPASASAVMIQVISHIRSLATTYHTVEFDIPEYKVGIKITGIGPTLKISIATDDDSLRQDLKSNHSDLSQILRRELASPTLELFLDPQSKDQGQNQQNRDSQHPQSDGEPDGDDTEL